MAVFRDRSAPRGLSATEVETRRHRDGPNVLPRMRGPSVWRRLLGQLVHFFAAMLWVASGLAFIAGMPQLGVAIVVVILANAGFAFAQEYRADRAVEHVQALVPRRATVIRDGLLLELDAAELVRDDVVRLSAGDRVPADIAITGAQSFSVDTAVLTGESTPGSVEAGDTAYAGTFVTEGEATGTVTAVGDQTRLAGIAQLTMVTRRPTPPLTRELKRVVRTISVIALSVGALFGVVTLALGTGPTDAFILGIGVTVALVPEALLPTVTLALALGAQRMAKRSAVVRRLESVETLGSTTVICTDKTGTLTRNEMAVVEVWTREGVARIDGVGYAPEARVSAPERAMDSLRTAADVALRTSRGRAVWRDGAWLSIGDPMEAALAVFAGRLGLEGGDEETPRAVERHRFPFDPRRRRMSVVVGDRVLVKGAPDSVLERCDAGPTVARAADEMAGRGLRVLALACRSLTDGTIPTTADEAERHLRFLALLGLEDPPKRETAAALTACRRAGIRVVMVTGDHPATAAAIAREVGMAGTGSPTYVGDELPDDEGAMGELIDHDGVVVARATPEQKVRIARALRARGHVVAMTGDGVNDGPALREADIGVAMGRSGTDVAREAADLVLLDDDFATIVTAITHGRSIFENARRFLTYHLTDNVAEVTPFIVWALSGGRFPLALGVLQILALDMGTDTLSAVALGAEPPRHGVLDRAPSAGRLLNKHVARRAFGLMGPLEASLTMLAFVVSLMASGWLPGSPYPTGDALLAASGAAFATVVLAQTANAFACRSTTRWPGALGWASNRLLVIGASIELVIAGAFLFLPAVATALGQQVPPPAGWLVALASGPIVIGVDALAKWWPHRGQRPIQDR